MWGTIRLCFIKEWNLSFLFSCFDELKLHLDVRLFYFIVAALLTIKPCLLHLQENVDRISCSKFSAANKAVKLIQAIRRVAI